MKKRGYQIANNRKTFFEFEILEKETAGIILTGTEVKSAKKKTVSISDSFCFFEKNELFIKNLHISEYDKGSIYNHEPKRTRKLLLTKKQLSKLHQKVTQKGITIIPLSIFVDDNGFIKVEVGLARGKKLYDKRESIKAKDLKREEERENKY